MKLLTTKKTVQPLKVPQATPVITHTRFFLKDWLVVFNILSAVTVVLTDVTNQNLLAVFVQDPTVLANISKWILLFTSVVNIILKLYASQSPVTFQSEKYTSARAIKS